MSYGADISDAYRHRPGLLVARILRGGPVMQPTRFSLAINMKTAKSLSLAVPSGVSRLPAR
jgi:putative tryptophan/tyrosine transport system substrate-binding protein